VLNEPTVTLTRCQAVPEPSCIKEGVCVPHIAVSEEVPGMGGLLLFKPSTGLKFSELAEQILRGPSPLSESEREMIAVLVSSRNECLYCAHSHAATAAHLLDGDYETVWSVVADPESSPVTDKMRALLNIAAKVQRSGLEVTAEDVAHARAAGAGDEDIHDAVLVAAFFSMANRYVDGLAAITPTDDEAYDQIGRRLAEQGYMSRFR
jgi:uncharacterized peroxidase-related enzyme